MSESTSTPATGLLDPALLNRYLKALDQPLPDVQPDTTPSSSGLFTRIISKLGEFAGSPGPETLQTLSPREREDAGLQALSRFGTGLLQASGSGQWIGSNLGSAFARAEKGYDQTGREAVGRLAARQGWAVQQQQDQLARIKEALPLLTLAQQQALVGRVPYSVGGGGGGGGGGGSFLDALASIESGDQNIVSGTDKDSQGLTLAQGGNASEISQGHFQIQTATWKDFAGKAGVDVNQYPTAMSAPREVQARVASVIPLSRFGPRTQDLLRTRFGPLDTSQTIGALAGTPALTFAPGTAGPRLAAGGGAPVPPPPVGTQPSGAQVAIPPPVKVAGPGAAPTPTASPEAPPAVSLLPGAVPPSMAPVGTTAAPEPTAPATPPPAAGPPVFSYRPSQIPPGLIPPGTFTPAQQAAMKTIEAAYVHERQVAATPADVQKAESNFGTNMAKVLGSQTDAAKVATDALLKFHEADFKQQQDTHAKILTDYYEQQKFARENEAKRQDAEQTQRYKLAEIEATGKQTRESTAAGAVVESNKRVRDNLGDDATAAAKTIPNLEALRALSDNVGPKDADLTKLATIPFMGTSLLNHLATLGLVDRTKAGAIQMLQGGIAGTVAQLRQGMSMGALSDRDLTFIESLGPNLYEDQATRSAVISYLQQSQRAKIRFNNEFNEEMTKPGANAATALRAARETMDAKHPIVPQMTASVAAHWDDQTPEWKAERVKWAAANGVKQHTLVRNPDGSLTLVK